MHPRTATIGRFHAMRPNVRFWPVGDRRHPTRTDGSDLKPAAQAAKVASAYRTAASVASVAGANGRFEKLDRQVGVGN